MKFSQKKWYALLLFSQLAITVITFHRHFASMFDSVFCTYGDGIKNYFNLQSYVNTPINSKGLFYYSDFAYPFGDYVYYTDNTPLFSIPFRWFCQHIVDISAYTISIYDFFIIGNLIGCGLLLFWVFQRLFKQPLIAFILSLALPWINPQFLRIFYSHLNLSLSSLSVIAIILFMLWQKHRNNIRLQALYTFIMVIFSIACFLIHGYYLAIITAFISIMMFYYTLFTFKNESGGIRNVVFSIVMPLMTLISTLLLLSFTDKYLPLRRDIAMGYDSGGFKLNFARLFAHYPYHHFFFPLYPNQIEYNVEQNFYLGNIGLFAFGFIFLGCAISYSFRTQILNIQKEYFSDPIKKSIFLAGLTLLIISFGEHYTGYNNAFLLASPFGTTELLKKYDLLILVATASFAIYTFSVLVKNRKSIFKFNTKNHTQLYILLGAILLILPLFFDYSISFINFLNPLYYIHFVSNRVEQFRCLSRFAWPFFWTFYIWLTYTLVKLYQIQQKPGKIFILLFLILLGSIEMTDEIINTSNRTNRENPFSKANLNNANTLKIDYSKYQAILPIPFYMVGSEVYAYTIDEEDDHSSTTMQFSLLSKLPLMACKMARTPPIFSVQLLNFVANDSLSPDLKQKLNTKPILVMYNKKLSLDTNAAYIPKLETQPNAHALCLKCLEFPKRNNLIAIDSNKDFVFYSYIIPRD